jgi:septal ring factor EnvC (AmiA/AmiB activator)
MAFNDLFSSAKGPGVVGMIMALIVLLGFGLLFMLAFDEGSQGGGKSLTAVIRDNSIKIGELHARLASGNEKIAKAPERKKIADELASALSKNKSITTQISAKKAEIVALKTNITTIEEEWSDYKNQYRSHVRSKAAGTQLAELKTLDGTVYTNVDIRSVTAVGMDIRHRDGFKRISFGQLPADIQDHYQFDKEQMLAEVQRETKERDEHDKATHASNLAVEGQMAEQRQKEVEAAKQKKLLEIAAKEARIPVLESEIQQIIQDIASAEAAADAARAAGKMHLSKAGSLRGALNSKRTALSQLQIEILRLKSSLN